MAPTARGRHGIVQSALLLVLAPHAEAAGLVATGPFNLGTAKDDFRVPDLGCHRGHIDPDLVYYATAAVVVEILSPHDETWEKLPFYASRGVDEVMVVDPEMRQVRIFVLGAGGYGEAGTSAMFGVEASEVEGAIRWP